MIGHSLEALRLAPERLQGRMDVRRELSHLADEPFKRSRGGRTEDLDEPSGRGWRTPVSRARQTRTMPTYASRTPTLDKYIAARKIRARCGVIVSHSVGGSINTRPATSSGWRAAYVRTTKLPNEWPTSTHRSGSLARLPRCGASRAATCASTVSSSSMIRVNVRGHEAPSLQPRPARSYAQTRVNFATSGCTRAQLREEAAIPDSSSTTGLPLPRHTACRRCLPASNSTPGGEY